jgi:hypothetical protein
VRFRGGSKIARGRLSLCVVLQLRFNKTSSSHLSILTQFVLSTAMHPRSLAFQATRPDDPAMSSGDLKQLELKRFLASQAEPRSSADSPNALAPPSGLSLKPAALLQSLEPVLKSVLQSLISENSSSTAWSKAALAFDVASGRTTSSSTLDKFNDDSASALDLGTRLAVSSSNERRLQNQLAASISEIAELRSNSRQSSDLSLSRENQELRQQLAAAQRLRSQSASQLEHQLQSKCASLQSENEMLESKCRRLQQEIQRLNETSLPANFWEGQHSVLSEIFDLKKEYEHLLSAHSNVRSEVKLLVGEKNSLLAQLSNKDYECSTLAEDVKSCKLKISRLEFELKSRMNESLNGQDSVAVSSRALFSRSPPPEAFVPSSLSASDRAAAPWASVSPYVSSARPSVPSAAPSASPTDVRPVNHFTAAEENSRVFPLHVASTGSYSPSQIEEVAEELPLSGQGSQSYSEKMKAVLDLVSTLDSRLLSLDAM